MTGDEWIIIPGWDKFQHYKDRSPAWIKLYTDLVANPEWVSLTCSQRGLLVSIWLGYALGKTQLRRSDVHRYATQRVRQESLDALARAGFIEFSASKPLARGYHDASPEKEKRREGVRPRSRARASGTPSGPKTTAFERAEAMTRNVGVQYTPESFHEELDRFDLTDQERDMLEALRSSLNGTVEELF